MLKDFLPWPDRAGAGAGPDLQVGAASAPAVSPNQGTGCQLLSTAVPGETASTDIYFVLVLTPRQR